MPDPSNRLVDMEQAFHCNIIPEEQYISYLYLSSPMGLSQLWYEVMWYILYGVIWEHLKIQILSSTPFTLGKRTSTSLRLQSISVFVMV